MKTGERRSPLDFQEQRRVPNDTEGFDERWVSIGTIMGNIKTTGGYQYTRGEQGDARTTHVITIPYQTGIHKKMRIFNNGIGYTIHRIDVDEVNRSKNLLISVHQEEDLI